LYLAPDCSESSMPYLSFAAGLVLLIVGADVLVRGGSKLA
jgi:hypothetical protein